jgi:phosphatidylglycerophosphatase A
MPTTGRHPPLAAWLVATWFGTGRLAGAPGTWGSLAAMPFAAALAWLGGPWLVLFATVVLFGLGTWATKRYMAALGVHDPSAVVVDEVVGQWLTLAFLPVTPLAYGLGLALFRIADVVKPWPANWIDRKAAGAAWVLLDDVVAGIYAAAAALLVLSWLP